MDRSLLPWPVIRCIIPGDGYTAADRPVAGEGVNNRGSRISGGVGLDIAAL
jgi:hypothetical protein